VPVLPSSLTAPIWDQLAVLLPPVEDHHPLGCHRPRVSDRVVFDKLILIVVSGMAYTRVADATCSATTIRRRRDTWIAAGVMDRLNRLALAAYDRIIGLDLTEVAVDGCITKAPCGGEAAGKSPVDRGKRGLKRSMLVDRQGIPLGWTVAPANRPDSPLLVPTLTHLTDWGPFETPPTVHLDAGYDSATTRERLADLGVTGEIARRGLPSPRQASSRWPVERTHAWFNASKKLAWCTERRTVVI